MNPNGQKRYEEHNFFAPCRVCSVLCKCCQDRLVVCPLCNINFTEREKFAGMTIGPRKDDRKKRSDAPFQHMLATTVESPGSTTFLPPSQSTKNEISQQQNTSEASSTSGRKPSRNSTGSKIKSLFSLSDEKLENDSASTHYFKFPDPEPPMEMKRASCPPNLEINGVNYEDKVESQPADNALKVLQETDTLSRKNSEKQKVGPTKNVNPDKKDKKSTIRYKNSDKLFCPFFGCKSAVSNVMKDLKRHIEVVHSYNVTKTYPNQQIQFPIDLNFLQGFSTVKVVMMNECYFVIKLVVEDHGKVCFVHVGILSRSSNNSGYMFRVNNLMATYQVAIYPKHDRAQLGATVLVKNLTKIHVAIFKP